MILQSSAVIRILEAYSIKVPEVKLRYSEDFYGIIVFVPKDFDTVPDLTRAVAHAEITNMMVQLKLIGTNPRVKIGNFLV